MKTAAQTVLLLVSLIVAGCNYAYPPAIRNGTDAGIPIRCVLNGGREYARSLAPGNDFWTSKDKNTEVLELFVDGRRFDLSIVADQYRNRVMFLVRKEGVVVLRMADLPKKWYELTSDELASKGTGVLKPK